MKLRLYYLIFILVVLGSSCDNTSDKFFRISNDSNNHEVFTFDENGDTLVSLSFFENGNIKSVDLKVDGNTDEKRKLSFYENGRIKTYRTSENRILTESHIMADSTGRAWGLYLINEDEHGVYLNQKIITNEYGTISEEKSYFLINESSYAVLDRDKRKIKLDIQIIGQKYKKSFAVIGDFDSTYTMKSNKVDTFYGTGNKIQCKVDAQKGLNIVRGYVCDYKGSITDSTLYGRKIYFTNKLIVPE